MLCNGYPIYKLLYTCWYMKTDSSHMLFIIHYIVISISLIMPQKKGTPSTTTTTTTTTTNNNTDRNTNNSNSDGNSNSKKRKNGSSNGSSIKLLKQWESANIKIDHSKKTYVGESKSTSSNISESELIKYNKKLDKPGYRRLKLNSKLSDTGRIVKSGDSLLNVLDIKNIRCHKTFHQAMLGG